MKNIEIFVFSSILLLVGFVAVNIAKAADPSVMHLKLDETVGATTSTDSTSNGHDGAITGTISLGQSGYDGTSYYFANLTDNGTITVDDYDYGSDGNFAIKVHWKGTDDDNAGTSYRYL